jgi:hypothetical protein
LTGHELLAALQAHGVRLEADGDRLAYSGPLGGLTDELRAEMTTRKAELLDLLRPPAPPAGTRLFFQDTKGAICWPENAAIWTYEGGPRWWYTKEHPVPPHEPALALLPWKSRRCPGCSGRKLRVTWQECGEGEKRLRVECVACGRFVDWLKRKPDNAELEWRATG